MAQWRKPLNSIAGAILALLFGLGGVGSAFWLDILSPRLKALSLVIPVVLFMCAGTVYVLTKIGEDR